MSVKRLFPKGRNLPDPHSGNILPQARCAPAMLGPESLTPSSSVPAMYPPVPVAQALVRTPAEQPDQDHHHRRQEAVGELDHPVLVTDQRDHLPPAERPALGAAAPGAAAEPGLTHADDSADDDQQEGDNS